MPARGEEVELTPTGFGPHGEGVATGPDDRTFSVPGTIPGERVRVTPLAHRRGIVHARLVAVVEPSAHRATPPCPEVANGCGACQWQHIGLDAQRAYKRELIAGSLGLPADSPALRPTVELPETGFRTTIHAAVAHGRAGLRRYRSHRVVPVDECLVAHPRIDELLTHGSYGAATDVFLRCGARTGERLAVPTPAGTTIDVPADVRSDHVHEHAAGREWRISARSFFQSRPDGVDALAEAVAAAAGEIGPSQRALDLYSGVGIFAGVLAERGWSVTAVESDRSAVADAHENLRALDVKVVRADVARWNATRGDLVVADPSRAGLERAGVGAVKRTGARRLVLVSCDAASLGRDAGLLRRAGYTLSSSTLVDLFPHTFHVEVVSVFDR